jgi:hypothetical protein
MLHQTIPDIRIMFGEGSRGCGVFAAKNDQRAVGGFRKRSGQNQLSAVVRGIGKLQMFFAKRSASLHNKPFPIPSARIGPTPELAYHGVGLDGEAVALPAHHCCRKVSSLLGLRALCVVFFSAPKTKVGQPPRGRTGEAALSWSYAFKETPAELLERGTPGLIRQLAGPVR